MFIMDHCFVFFSSLNQQTIFHGEINGSNWLVQNLQEQILNESTLITPWFIVSF